jgi:hypothetical protein
MINLNSSIWKQANVGGTILGIFLLFVGASIFFVISLDNFWQKKVDIEIVENKINIASKHVSVLDVYKNSSKKETHFFATFKKNKWQEPLTLELLNKVLYKIQKQTDVEFLFINSPNFTTENGFARAQISLQLKVLRDYTFFSFLKKLETEMPGIVKIIKFELRRDKEISREITQKIKEGEKTNLFEGSIDFEIVHEYYAEKF